jgi:ferritin
MKPNKLEQEVVDLLLPRLNDEYKAFYMYRAAGNWCKDVGFFKAAAFFAAESEDELEHAKKIEQYIVDWNVTPDLPTVEKPQIEFADLMEIIEAAYGIEYDLYEAYEKTSMDIFNAQDLCTFDFLQEFRTIQRKSVAEYADKLNMLEGVDGKDKFKMLLLEEQLFQVNG